MASRPFGRPALTQRQRLGARLKALREISGLRNEDVAAAVGVSPATVSRMERGDRLIKTAEIHAWIQATGGPPEARAELAALAEAAATQSNAWRTKVEAGKDTAQEDVADREASAATILSYDHAILPGLVHTRDYARSAFQKADVGTADIDGKVERRMQRQAVLLDQSKNFTLLMTEGALRWRPGSVDQHVEQLQRVLAVDALPNVAVGILPANGRRRVLYPENFAIYADRIDGLETIVTIELVTDELEWSNAERVDLYRNEFERLRGEAQYGANARTLIECVAEEIRDEPTT